VSDAIRAEAPAKINLTLEVVERLASGYHRIRSVFVTLPRLRDVVSVDIRPGTTRIAVTSNSLEVPCGEENICHRITARYLHETKTSARVSIQIEKNVPVAAGLGGGSSDAATVLRVLNRHFAGRLSPRELSELALDIGRDIPFFLANVSAALVTGTGEKVSAIECDPSLRVLVVNPGVAVSTKLAYETLSARLWFMARGERSDRSKRMVDALRARALPQVYAGLYNDFELVVEPAHGVIKEIKQALVALGAEAASMSGSGPTVFGLFASDEQLRVAEQTLREHYPSFVIACGSH
jgi:4-diphosphocytidyl-2-C-methyl-D-erythritol kinase